MQEKKKIPWGLLYVILTVVILLVFGLVNREFYGMVFQDSDVAKWLEAVAGKKTRPARHRGSDAAPPAFV